MTTPKPYTREEVEADTSGCRCMDPMYSRGCPRCRILATIDALTPKPEAEEVECIHKYISDTTGKCVVCRRQMREPAQAEAAKVHACPNCNYGTGPDGWCPCRKPETEGDAKVFVPEEHYEQHGPARWECCVCHKSYAGPVTEPCCPPTTKGTPPCSPPTGSFSTSSASRSESTSSPNSSGPASPPGGGGGGAGGEGTSTPEHHTAPSPGGIDSIAPASAAGTSETTATPASPAGGEGGMRAGMLSRCVYFLQSRHGRTISDVVDFAASELVRVKAEHERDVRGIKERLGNVREERDALAKLVGELDNLCKRRAERLWEMSAERDAARREVEELTKANQKLGCKVMELQDDLESLREQGTFEGRMVRKRLDDATHVSKCLGATYNEELREGEIVLILAPRDDKPASEGPAMRTLRTAPQSGSMATEHAIQAIFELDARVRQLEGRYPPASPAP